MFAPHNNKRHMIFTVWSKPRHKKLRIYVSPEALAQFFPISVGDATIAIGENGFRILDSDGVTQLLQHFTVLFNGFRETAKAAI